MPSSRGPRPARRARGLARRALLSFGADDVVTGRDLVTRGAVDLVAVEARTAVALVTGLTLPPARVNVAAPVIVPGVLRVACTCAVGQGRVACSHMFATLLALEQRAVDLGLDGSRAMVDVVRPWASAPARVKPALDDDEDDDATVARPRRRPRSRPPKPAVTPIVVEDEAALPLTLRPRSWTERLAWLATDDTRPRSGGGLAPHVIEYQLTVHDPLDLGGVPRALPPHVELAVYQRPLRSDGTPGPRALRRMRFDGADASSSLVDGRAIAALRLGTPELEAATSSGSPASTVGPSRASGTSVLVDAAVVDRVLPAVAATGRLGWLDPELDPADDRATTLRRLRWDGDVAFQLVLALDAADHDVVATAWLIRGDERIALATLATFFGGGCVALGDRLVCVEPGDSLARWWVAFRAGPLVVPGRQIERFVERLAAIARLPALVIDPAIGWRVETIAPTPHLHLEPRAGGVHHARALAAYGAARRPAGARGALIVDVVRQVVHPVDRDAEAQFVTAIEALLPGAPSVEELVVPAGGLTALVPALDGLGWQVWLRAKRVRSGGVLHAQVASGIDWFDVTLGAVIDGQTVDAQTLIDALRTGASLVRLGDGSHGVVPAAWIERHRALIGQGPNIDGLIRVPRNRALVLDVLLEALPEVDRDAAFVRLRDRLTSFDGVAPRTEPPGFAGELRPYQRDGLGWLEFLRELGFGGCLADDMGLGKTVQVLAAIVETQRTSGRPALVVAPRSVVWNWLDEAARFAPGLRVVEHGGLDRKARLLELDQADLIVTSYATMRRDIEDLSQRTFGYVILDEAQAIKNPDAQVARAARLLRGEHRLALTGTPVENHLGDLASIFEFLNPGMLDGVSALRGLGDHQGLDADALTPLARALRPFLLRRTKAEVLPELPARSEQVLKVRLEGAQRRFYDRLRDGYRASLLGRVERDGMGRSTMHVLEALLRLRQAACAPVLVAPERAGDGSAKLDVLLEQLAEVVGEGHKVLVFSQFTALLALVRTRLRDAGIDHEYLDGQTRDRKARVARFQNDPACQVFAISLKAGGTGLNLTAASYVFLLDPWWNPAVEAQAIDRSHRLGQTRAVTAYRLIAEDTVEDKILALQDHKRALLDGLFAEDAGRLASLTADDLALLLAP